MITKEEITLNDFLIPANFEDSGKIMGFFSTRNVVEAVILALPFAFIVFKLCPVGLTWKIILSSVFVIPIGGLALMGIRRSAEYICPYLVAMAEKQKNIRV